MECFRQHLDESQKHRGRTEGLKILSVLIAAKSVRLMLLLINNRLALDVC